MPIMPESYRVHDHFDSLNKALTDYNIYLEYRPDHHEALLGRAQVRLRLNQYELAKGDLLKMLDLPLGETTAIFFGRMLPHRYR